MPDTLPKAKPIQFENGTVCACAVVDTSHERDVPAWQVPKGEPAWDMAQHAGLTGLAALSPLYLGARL